MKTWKRSIKIAGLFLTLSNVPVKKRNSRKVGDRDNIDSTFRMKNLRRETRATQGDRCPMCGEVSERMELHHILPVSRFPELWNDRRNCVALCHDCHKEIHCNPWANIRMMEAKAAELGLDLGERYERKLTTIDGVIHHFADDEIAAVHYNDPKGMPMSIYVSSKGISAGDKVKIIIVKTEQ